MKNINLSTFVKYLAIAGNVLFVLWITYNGIDEGFRCAIYQKGGLEIALERG